MIGGQVLPCLGQPKGILQDSGGGVAGRTLQIQEWGTSLLGDLPHICIQVPAPLLELSGTGTLKTPWSNGRLSVQNFRKFDGRRKGSSPYMRVE